MTPMMLNKLCTNGVKPLVWSKSSPLVPAESAKAFVKLSPERTGVRDCIVESRGRTPVSLPEERMGEDVEERSLWFMSRMEVVVVAEVGGRGAAPGRLPDASCVGAGKATRAPSWPRACACP